MLDFNAKSAQEGQSVRSHADDSGRARKPRGGRHTRLDGNLNGLHPTIRCGGEGGESIQTTLESLTLSFSLSLMKGQRLGKHPKPQEYGLRSRCSAVAVLMQCCCGAEEGGGGPSHKGEGCCNSVNSVLENTGTTCAVSTAVGTAVTALEETRTMAVNPTGSGRP